MTAERAPVRIQRRRTKGWRLPAGAVIVSRPSKWGNPFKAATAIECDFLRSDSSPEEVHRFLAECFRDWLVGGSDRDWWQGPESDASRRFMLDNLRLLRGKDLACWCPLDHCCHGSVLLNLANR